MSSIPLEFLQIANIRMNYPLIHVENHLLRNMGGHRTDDMEVVGNKCQPKMTGYRDHKWCHQTIQNPGPRDPSSHLSESNLRLEDSTIWRWRRYFAKQWSVYSIVITSARRMNLQRDFCDAPLQQYFVLNWIELTCLFILLWHDLCFDDQSSQTTYNQ